VLSSKKLVNSRSQEDRVRQKLYSMSLLKFGQEVYKLVENKEYVHGKHAEVLVRHLEAAVRKDDPIGRIKRLLINMPPSTSKSFWIMVALPAWIYTWWPECEIQCFSYNPRLSAKHHDMCRRLVGSQWYQRYFPHVRVRLDKDSQSYFALESGGNRLCGTVGSGFTTGNHPDVILYDDPQSVETAFSFAETEKVSKFFFETMPSRGVAKDAVHIVSQQRLSVTDLSQYIIEHMKDIESQGMKSPWVWLMLPMEYDPEWVMRDVGYGGDWRTEKGQLLFPEVINHERLENLRQGLATRGPWAVRAQLDQRPVRTDKSIFKVNKIKERPFAEFPVEFERVHRFWDLAATDGAGCYTAGALVGMVDNRFYLLDMQRQQLGPDEVESLIERTAERDAYTYGGENKAGKKILGTSIEREGGSSGKWVDQYLSLKFAKYNIRMVPPKKDKVERAGCFSTYVEQGRFTVPVDATWKKAFLSEVESFPVGKYKDQVDAVSGAFLEIMVPNKEAGGGIVLASPEKSVPDDVKFCKNELCGRPAEDGKDYCCPCCELAWDEGEKCERHDPECNHRYNEWFVKQS
jgi:predicted phage terminase large subunit-like protein